MTFRNAEFWIPIAIAFLALAPLALRAWKTPTRREPVSRLALAARILGIALLLFSLADPQRISERPIKGANLVALLADNGQGLRIRDPDSNLNRGEHMREHLSGRESVWLGKVEEQYQVRNYSFDSHLRRVASFQSLDFAGERSDLGQALSEVTARLARLPLAGIAVFTDGNATDLAQFPDDLSELPPIFPIIVGSEEPVPDLAFDTPILTQSAFDDAPLSLRATVLAQGFGDASVEITLAKLPKRSTGFRQRADDTREVIEEKRVSLDDEDAEAAVRFEWTPSESGIQFYEVSATRVATNRAEPTEEATLENNRRVVVADRGAERYRILYVTGRPNWEYKFLNRALAEDPQLDLVALIRVAKREPKFEFKGRSGESGNPLYRGFGREDELERYDESVLIRMNTKDEEELKAGFPSDVATLFAYDAIVIDDLEANFFTFNQQTLLREFVKQRGGGLLLLGGVNALNDGGYKDTPLAQALPVYLDENENVDKSDRSITWDLTREGWVEPWTRIRANETDERQRLQDMPSLKVFNALPNVKPGSTVLATVEDARGRTLPGLVTRNFGSGRVANVAVGDFWRWGLQGPSEQNDLAQFWRQMARWLVKDNPKQVDLIAESDVEGGFLLTATARDKEYRPIEMGSAKLVVTQLNSPTQIDGADDDAFESLELAMKPVPNEPGQFSLHVPLDQEGAYLAHIFVTDQDGVAIGEAETGWVSQPLVEEFASTQPNLDLMERIASETGGRVLRLSDVSELGAELAKRPSQMTETWSDPLWHKNWFFLLALGCFLVEWMIRRRKGLA